MNSEPLRYDMAYPLAATLPTDLIHLLPTVHVIPPIQKEIFACNEYHLIQLTELEAKDLAETQQNFIEYLQPFVSQYQVSMIAYKRALHMALTSFSMKVLIFILTVNMALEKYNYIFTNSSFKEELDQSIEEFNKRMEQVEICFKEMRIGFNPNNWSIKNVTVSQEELDFVFQKFGEIDRPKDSIPVIYSCSFVAQELLLGFSLFMKELFIPMSEILKEKFGKPPMMLMRLMSVKRIQMARVSEIDVALNDTLNIVRKEYNFWHQLPTNQNPSLYYMVMRQLEGAIKLKHYNPLNIRAKIKDHPSRVLEKVNYILNDIGNFIQQMVKQYKNRKINDFTTLFSFRSTDGVEQLYYEHVSTEVRLFSNMIIPIHTFAAKYLFIKIYLDARIYPLSDLLSITFNEPFAHRLSGSSVSYKDYPSILIVRGKETDHSIKDQALLEALKLNTQPSEPKPERKKYDMRRNVMYAHDEIDELFDRLWKNSAKISFENYDARRLKGPLSRELMETRKFERGLVVPFPPRALERYNPMEFWPLIPKEENMCNKPGEPYDIFVAKKANDRLLQQEEEVAIADACSTSS
ncbi:hypothetical protein SNEBB_005588 [Seison nebaliae]|nr:hypothetical protein SNEBB_005588 [Seison nebaliae]